MALSVRSLTLPAVLLLAVTGHGRAQSDDVSAYLSDLAPPPAARALEAIDGPGRKLLALRSYLRAGPGLAGRWSWTEAEIRAFQGSPEQKAMLAAVAAVKARFAEDNPGYELYVNTRIRSLDVQIGRWNENGSVEQAAGDIYAAWTDAFGLDGDGPMPDFEASAAWLKSYRPPERAHVAAPGLTAHGQGHAIDFQVMKDGTIIAGADSGQVETVWRADGWDRKLKQAMDAAGPSFSGPLTSPDEPWHYSYDPDIATGSDRHRSEPAATAE
ncbi:hypothetical protein [Zhengella mangrovi]|uniref:hypothetical protein n=1 Tax=Zhengella mangrovi TaxID=1982044 RepID=UPI00105436AE|nr:hypothetical protein [Zhengella mangrovi]